jgi:hypothetical protein
MSRITYELRSEHDVRATFSIDLQAMPTVLDNAREAAAPTWCRLEHERCPGCPLDAQVAPLCPMALALVELLTFARALVSHSAMEVSVLTENREVRATVTAQRALSSLMGLVIATSGCPDAAWLRPMANFHLPLASEEETLYRAVSMYLLAQYFRAQHGQTADFSLAGLSRRYRRMHVINTAIARRLRDAIEEDAPVNAVILLDMFAKAAPYSVDESLSELEPIFRSYLD